MTSNYTTTIRHRYNTKKRFGEFFETCEYERQYRAGYSVQLGNGHGADLYVDNVPFEVKASHIGTDGKFQFLLQQKNRTSLQDKHILVLYFVYGGRHEGYIRVSFRIPDEYPTDKTLKVGGDMIAITNKLESLGFKMLRSD